MLFCAGSSHADIAFPPLSGRVVDQVGLLSDEQQQQLTNELAAEETRSGNQVVVAIVKSLQGQAIEDYGYQLGRHWGIGQKDKNNGVILLVAPTEHQVRIEVGYGLEGTLTDAQSARIIHQIILPAFKQGQMGQGVVAGADAIVETLDGGAPMPAPNLTQRFTKTDMAPAQNAPADPIVILFIVLFVLVWIFLCMRGGRTGMMMGFIGSGLNFSGGGFSGGGFSGGGGSFGGGGASGSW